MRVPADPASSSPAARAASSASRVTVLLDTPAAWPPVPAFTRVGTVVLPVLAGPVVAEPAVVWLAMTQAIGMNVLKVFTPLALVLGSSFG